MTRKKQGMRYLEIAWDDHGAPVSPLSAETYSSAFHPVEEREKVFLRGNGLPEAWKGRKSFCIAELGFGLGLSFLLTWKLWREHRDNGAALDFVSFEKNPVSPDSLARGLSRFPELKELQASLLKHYPPPILGVHRIIFSEDVRLTLAVGDAHELLPLLTFSADVWFLDGFSPAKNPEMWNERIAQLVTERSSASATFSTYSVAKPVRESFSRCGWNVEKREGSPPKKEMLTGHREQRNHLPRPRPSATALVVGAGIAGSAVAEALSRRGVGVTLLERERTSAQGASGNPAGILMPHVSLDPDPMSRFALKGYLHALSTIERLSETAGETFHDFCGVFRLGSSERLATLVRNFQETGLDEAGIASSIAAEESVDVCGMKTLLPGIFFPRGGWVDPARFSAFSLARSGITTICNSCATTLRRSGDSWEMLSDAGTILARADIVVLANSYAALDFEECRWLPLEKVRGQLVTTNATEISRKLRSVVCFDGYILPARDDRHVVGATYDHGDDRTEPDLEQSLDLLKRVADGLPELQFLPESVVGSRVSFRGMSRDRLPIVGRMPVLSSYVAETHWREDFVPQYYPNLAVSLGHGSRGLITAHLSAEILVAELLQEPSALEDDLLEHLHAERYLTRLLKRGTLINPESAASWKVEYRRTSERALPRPALLR